MKDAHTLREGTQRMLAMEEGNVKCAGRRAHGHTRTLKAKCLARHHGNPPCPPPVASSFSARHSLSPKIQFSFHLSSQTSASHPHFVCSALRKQSCSKREACLGGVGWGVGGGVGCVCGGKVGVWGVCVGESVLW